MAENETPPSPDKGDPNLPLLKTNGSESTPPKAEVYGLQESPAPIPQTIQPTKGTQPSQIVTKPAKQGSDGFRELLETIVFVLVLVLVLKSFVAEAFVIPTGSMAETLYGYQKLVKCPTCTHLFPVNCSSEVEQTPGAGTFTVSSCTCPNCLLGIRLLKPNEQSFPDEPAVPDPGCTTGDRVLVAKYLYDLPGNSPQRFDVVVFKYPGNSNPNEFNLGSPRFPTSGPQRNHTPMNYIKRLIGLPGETIGLKGGKLYRIAPGLVPPPNSKPDHPQDLWMWQFMHENEARDLLVDSDKFEIIRKPPSAVMSMKRIVFDDRERPLDLPGIKRWQSQKPAWVEPIKSVHKCDSSQSKEMEWLRYQHILRNNEGRRQLITDVMGYNTTYYDPHRPGYGDNWVSDLVLEGEFEIQKAEGELTLELSKGAHRFQARWNLQTGACELHRISKDKDETLASMDKFPLKPGKHQLRFSNVDCRLIVWQNGKLIFGDGVDYTPPKFNGPTMTNDLEPASIGCKGSSIVASDLKLFRDTYYTARINPSTPDVSVNDWTEPPNRKPGQEIPDAWKPLNNPPIKTLFVQPGHYLCLGDNSPQSSDGRSWGLVPDNLMMGRAVVIYFPFHRMGRIQ